MRLPPQVDDFFRSLAGVARGLVERRPEMHKADEVFEHDRDLSFSEVLVDCFSHATDEIRALFTDTYLWHRTAKVRFAEYSVEKVLEELSDADSFIVPSRMMNFTITSAAMKVLTRFAARTAKMFYAYFLGNTFHIVDYYLVLLRRLCVRLFLFFCLSFILWRLLPKAFSLVYSALAKLLGFATKPFSEPDPDNEAMGGVCAPSDVLKLVLGLGCVALLGYIPGSFISNVPRFGSFFGINDAANRAFTGALEKALNYIARFFKLIHCKKAADWCEEQSANLAQTNFDKQLLEYNELMASTSKLLAQKSTPSSGPGTSTYAVALSDAITSLNNAANVVSLIPGRQPYALSMQAQVQRLEIALAMSEQLRETGGQRVCPPFLLLIGAPGIGKTFAVNTIVQVLAQCFGHQERRLEMAAAAHSLTYSYNGNKYFSGYYHQPVILLNDVFSTALGTDQVDREKFALEKQLIQEAVDSVAWMPSFAEIATPGTIGKGTPVAPMFLLGTTNYFALNFGQVDTHPLGRRIHLPILTVLKDGYETPDRYQPDLSHLAFYLKQSQMFSNMPGVGAPSWTGPWSASHQLPRTVSEFKEWPWNCDWREISLQEVILTWWSRYLQHRDEAADQENRVVEITEAIMGAPHVAVHLRQLWERVFSLLQIAVSSTAIGIHIVNSHLTETSTFEDSISAFRNFASSISFAAEETEGFTLLEVDGHKLFYRRARDATPLSATQVEVVVRKGKPTLFAGYALHSHITRLTSLLTRYFGPYPKTIDPTVWNTFVGNTTPDSSGRYQRVLEDGSTVEAVSLGVSTSFRVHTSEGSFLLMENGTFMFLTRECLADGARQVSLSQGRSAPAVPQETPSTQVPKETLAEQIQAEKRRKEPDDPAAREEALQVLDTSVPVHAPVKSLEPAIVAAVRSRREHQATPSEKPSTDGPLEVLKSSQEKKESSQVPPSAAPPVTWLDRLVSQGVGAFPLCDEDIEATTSVPENQAKLRKLILHRLILNLPVCPRASSAHPEGDRSCFAHVKGDGLCAFNSMAYHLKQPVSELIAQVNAFRGARSRNLVVPSGGCLPSSQWPNHFDILSFSVASGLGLFVSYHFGKPGLDFQVAIIPEGATRLLPLEFRPNEFHYWALTGLQASRPLFYGLLPQALRVDSYWQDLSFTLTSPEPGQTLVHKIPPKLSNLLKKSLGTLAFCSDCGCFGHTTRHCTEPNLVGKTPRHTVTRVAVGSGVCPLAVATYRDLTLVWSEGQDFQQSAQSFFFRLSPESFKHFLSSKSYLAELVTRFSAKILFYPGKPGQGGWIYLWSMADLSSAFPQYVDGFLKLSETPDDRSLASSVPGVVISGFPVSTDPRKVPIFLETHDPDLRDLKESRDTSGRLVYSVTLSSPEKLEEFKKLTWGGHKLQVEPPKHEAVSSTEFPLYAGPTVSLVTLSQLFFGVGSYASHLRSQLLTIYKTNPILVEANPLGIPFDGYLALLSDPATPITEMDMWVLCCAYGCSLTLIQGEMVRVLGRSCDPDLGAVQLYTTLGRSLYHLGTGAVTPPLERSCEWILIKNRTESAFKALFSSRTLTEIALSARFGDFAIRALRSFIAASPFAIYRWRSILFEPMVRYFANHDSRDLFGYVDSEISYEGLTGRDHTFFDVRSLILNGRTCTFSVSQDNHCCGRLLSGYDPTYTYSVHAPAGPEDLRAAGFFIIPDDYEAYLASRDLGSQPRFVVHYNDHYYPCCFAGERSSFSQPISGFLDSNDPRVECPVPRECLAPLLPNVAIDWVLPDSDWIPAQRATTCVYSALPQDLDRSSFLEAVASVDPDAEVVFHLVEGAKDPRLSATVTYSTAQIAGRSLVNPLNCSKIPGPETAEALEVLPVDPHAFLPQELYQAASNLSEAALVNSAAEQKLNVAIVTQQDDTPLTRVVFSKRKEVVWFNAKLYIRQGGQPIYLFDTTGSSWRVCRLNWSKTFGGPSFHPPDIPWRSPVVVEHVGASVSPYDQNRDSTQIFEHAAAIQTLFAASCRCSAPEGCPHQILRSDKTIWRPSPDLRQQLSTLDEPLSGDSRHYFLIPKKISSRDWNIIRGIYALLGHNTSIQCVFLNYMIATGAWRSWQNAKDAIPLPTAVAPLARLPINSMHFAFDLHTLACISPSLLYAEALKLARVEEPDPVVIEADRLVFPDGTAYSADLTYRDVFSLWWRAMRADSLGYVMETVYSFIEDKGTPNQKKLFKAFTGRLFSKRVLNVALLLGGAVSLLFLVMTVSELLSKMTVFKKSSALNSLLSFGSDDEPQPAPDTTVTHVSLETKDLSLGLGRYGRMAVPTLENLQRANNHSLHITYTNNLGVRSNLWGFLVDNQTLIFPSHLVPRSERGQEFFHFSLSKAGQDDLIECDIPRSHIHFAVTGEPSDLAVVRINTLPNVRTFKNFVDAIPPIGTKVSGVILPDGAGPKPDMAMLFDSQVLEYKAINYHAGEDGYRDELLAIGNPGVAHGHCGSLLFVGDLVCGCLVAKSGDSLRAFFTPLTRSLLQKLVAHLPTKILPPKNQGNIGMGSVACGARVLNVNPVRTRWVPTETEIRPSALYGWIPNHNAYGPAVQTVEAMKVAQEKFTTKPTFYDQDAFGWVVETLSNLTPRAGASPFPTVAAAANGRTTQDHNPTDLDPVVLNTSPGLPWTKEGHVDKTKLYTRSTSGLLVPCPLLEERTLQVFRNFTELELNPPLVSLSLKDEVRTVDKIKAKKTRLFAACAHHHNLALRMALGRWIAWFKKSGQRSFHHAIGLVWQSDQWTSLGDYLCPSSAFEYLAMDYSRFDTTHTEDQYEAVARIIQPFFEKRHAHLVAGAVASVASYRFSDGDVTFEMARGLPSGSQLTTPFNCLFNLIAWLYAWRRLSGLGFAEFREHCRFICFGDDCIFGADRFARHFMVPSQVQSAIAELGYTIEPATADLSTAYVPFEQVVFLHRTFERVHGHPRIHWRGPLYRPQVFRPLMFIRSDTHEARTSAVAAVCEETMAYNEDEMQETLALIYSYCAHDPRWELAYQSVDWEGFYARRGAYWGEKEVVQRFYNFHLLPQGNRY